MATVRTDFVNNTGQAADADYLNNLGETVNGLVDTAPVQITQAAYNALGSGRPARLYAIVG